MIRRLLPLLGILLLLGAGPDHKEDRAWKDVAAAVKKGDAEATLAASERFLGAFPDSDRAAQAHLEAGNAAVALERWRPARRHFETYLREGGRTGLEEAKFGLALALARDGHADDAIPALANVAKHDKDEKRAAAAARELVALHMFDGQWKRALSAQELLVERGLYELPRDLDESRRAAEFLSDDALQQLEEKSREAPVGGVLMLLLLDRAGAMVDSPETAPIRRRFAALYADHPMAALIPGVEALDAAPEDTDPGKVGVLLPLSGRYAAPGRLARRGVELAADRIEELGLERFELVFADTAGDPAVAVAELERLATEEKVIAVLGPIVATEAEAVVPRALELGVPLLMMTQKGGLAAGQPGVFNTWVTAEEQVDALVEFVMGQLALRSFAIAYPALEGPAALAARFWADVEGKGGAVVAVENYDASSTDFRETAQKVLGTWYGSKAPGEADRALAYMPGRDKPQLGGVSLKPGVDFEAVFVPDGYKRMSMLGPGFLYEEINVGGHLDKREFPPVFLLGGSSLVHPDFVERAGGAADGAVAADGFFATAKDDATRWFVGAYQAAYGATPTALEAVTFDTAAFLTQLLAEGVQTRRGLLARLERATPAFTVTGARGVGPDGEMRHEVKVLRVEDGAWRHVWPPLPAPPEATGAAPAEPPHD